MREIYLNLCKLTHRIFGFDHAESFEVVHHFGLVPRITAEIEATALKVQCAKTEQVKFV